MRQMSLHSLNGPSLARWLGYRVHVDPLVARRPFGYKGQCGRGPRTAKSHRDPPFLDAFVDDLHLDPVMAKVCVIKAVGLTPALARHAPNISKLGTARPWRSPIPAVMVVTITIGYKARVRMRIAARNQLIGYGGCQLDFCYSVIGNSVSWYLCAIPPIVIVTISIGYGFQPAELIDFTIAKYDLKFPVRLINVKRSPIACSTRGKYPIQ